MKKVIGLLILLITLSCAGISVFAAPEDVPDYIRVGISSGSVGSSYEASSSDGFAIYQYDGGDITQVESFEDITDIVIKADEEYINIYPVDEEDQPPVYSYNNTTKYFVGSTDMEEGIISVSGKSYRGGVMLYKSSASTIRFINVLDPEKYLYGVLPKEMSSSYPLEALKAQAVAARSFAMGNINRHSSLGYDICNTQCCQVYGGVSSEVAKCSSAVNETSGMVAYYAGKPVSCYYSANNGGYIESSKDIWGTEVGYLQTKKDEYNPEYNWTAEFTTEKLSSILKNAGYSIGTVTGINIKEKTEGGSVTSLEFVGTDGKAVIGKSKIRSMLGSSTVKSLKFTITKSSLSSEASPAKAYVKGVSGSATEKILSGMSVVDKNGNVVILAADSVVAQADTGKSTIQGSAASSGEDGVDGIVLSGKGYGHCIGMSQMGAKAMAEAGFSYDEILKYYYIGITIK
ncbi:MAG: SpoIID/LytB domain-containing protein [Firmicutes bacterium]|nr:SpoIID/LytB domain-containing protein [Bacillota bacterium]